MQSRHVLLGLMISNNEFIKRLKKAMKFYGLTVKDFCKKSKIPENTLYKIMSVEDKDFKVSTLKNIFKTLQKLEGSDEKFVAIITSRSVLDKIRKKEFFLGKEKIRLKEYPSTSLEEIMGVAIRAEKEGAHGIICGPIAAASIKNLVSIPITAISFFPEGIDDAISTIKTKI